MKSAAAWIDDWCAGKYKTPDFIEAIREEQRELCAEAIRSLFRGGAERPPYLNIIVTDILNAGKGE